MTACLSNLTDFIIDLFLQSLFKADFIALGPPAEKIMLSSKSKIAIVLSPYVFCLPISGKWTSLSSKRSSYFNLSRYSNEGFKSFVLCSYWLREVAVTTFVGEWFASSSKKALSSESKCMSALILSRSFKALKLSCIRCLLAFICRKVIAVAYFTQHFYFLNA